MILSNVKMALATLAAYKIRSFLTMLGIIVGVFSIVLVVSLGEGLKTDIQEQVDEFGSDLVVLTPNRAVERDVNGEIISTNLLAGLGGAPFTQEQFSEVRKVPGVKSAVSQMLVDSGATLVNGNRTIDGVLLAGTQQNYPEVISQELVSGQFFTDKSESIVLSESLAIELFNDSAPLARTIKIKDSNLAVIGVIEDIELSVPGVGDASKIAFVPVEIAKELTGTQALYSEIDVKVENFETIDQTASSIRNVLFDLRGDEDFSYLAGDETADAINSTFGIVTRFLSAIASIMFIVGGIGVMNVMLTTVSEREYEIGIRKAIGAPRSTILWQFLIEAVVLSILGAVFGVIFAYLAGLLIVAYTDLSIGVSWPIIGFALLSATVVGVIFGLAPALKASRKDPIAALRRQ